MNQRTLFLLLFLIVGFNSVAQEDLQYTLSDDSLVNHHASIKRVYYATRTEIKPKIDGVLTDECWQTIGKWDGGFIQQQPYQAKPPSQETEIKILYDDKYLYFGIICHDNEPELMSPIMGRRDENSGDIAGIALDSYNDKQTAFEFNVTAAGQKIDLMHMGEYGWDFNWDAVWDGKSSLGDSAWYIEMRVPFTQLRFANNKEHVWGMHIWRWIHRLNEEDQWKLIPIDAPAMVYIFGELRGIKDIPYKRNFEVMPYGKARYIPESDDNRIMGFGVDGKIGVTSDFTLDYTVNPDFGQVEADPSVLNLTSYEVFYDEKRPFFLEGNSILEYKAGRDQLFYSRRIGHAPSYNPDVYEDEKMQKPENTSILNALKLTGKNKKGLSVGVINSMTAKETATITSADEKNIKTVEPFTNYFIGRVKQDFNDGSTTIGGIVTSSIRNIKDEHLNFLPDNATVGGLDFEHNWLNRKYFINAKSFYSKVNGDSEAISKLQRSSRHLFQRVDASHLNYNSDLTSLSGWGGEITGGKRSGKLRVTASVEWRSPGVNLNDLGYMWQADYIAQDANALYAVSKPKGILNSYWVSLQQRHYWSFGGENLKDELDSHARIRFKNEWVMNLDLDRTYNEMDTRQLRGGPALRIDDNTSGQIFLETNRSKDFSMGGGVDLTLFDNNISRETRYDLHAQWRITNNFSITSHTRFAPEIDNSQYVRRSLVNDNTEYVVGKINRKTLFTTLRAEYFVTPELSFQYYGSPYTSVGKYVDYRRVEESKSKDVKNRYSPLFVINDGGNKLLVDRNNNVYHDFADWSPDFSFQEINSNFVLRWEYKTGSTFYFVWTNSLSGYIEEYNPKILESFKDLKGVKAQNAFMIKLSYWFSL